MDASTPFGFAKCATTHGGVVNTTVMIGHLTQEHDPPDTEIKGITEFNHFVFEEDGVRVKKHSKMGDGKFLELSKAEMPEKFSYEIWQSEEGQGKRTSYKPFKKPGSVEKVDEAATEKKEEDLLPEEGEENDMGGTFQCPNELCDERFKTNLERELHCLSKQCSLTVKQYVSKLWTSQFSVSMFGNLTKQDKNAMPYFLTPYEVKKVIETIARLLLDFEPVFCEGFALKKRKPNKKFTLDQEAFVKGEFDKGEAKKSRKVTPEQVVKRMRREKIPDPENPGQMIHRFGKSEWLTEAQVKGLYSKYDKLRTEKGKEATMSVDETTSLSTNYDHHAYHDAIANLVDQANEEQPISEQDHPFIVSKDTSGLIIVHSLKVIFQVGNNNVCDLVRQHQEKESGSDLSTLPFKQLQTIVRALNNGKGTRSLVDGQKLVINYVKENCVCLKQY